MDVRSRSIDLLASKDIIMASLMNTERLCRTYEYSVVTV